MLHICLEIRSI